MTALLILTALTAAVSAPIWMPLLRWSNIARELGVARPTRTTAHMRFMLRVPPARVYGAMLRARDAGVPLDVDAAMAHLLVGGRLEHVLDAMVEARALGVPLDFAGAAALDLYGADPLQLVRSGPRTAEGGLDLRDVMARGPAPGTVVDRVNRKLGKPPGR